jgi:antitoxin ParD1/3/4
MTVSVDLGARLEKSVEDLVSSGRYNSKSEVLREGVRLVEEREARLAAINASITEGVADADAGRFEDMDIVFDRVEGRLAGT